MFDNTTIINFFNATEFVNSTPPEKLTQSQIIIFGIIFGAIDCVGIVGNSLVILAVASDSKMRRSAMNVLLLNLAIADLGNLIVCIPDNTNALLQRGWTLPWPSCNVIRYLQVLFLYTSLLTQLAVSIERFFAIAMPMKIKLFCSRKKVQMWALMIWALAMCAGSPYVIFHHQIGARCMMVMDPYVALIHKFAECLLFYFIPLIIIVVLYSKISLILWSSNAQLHEGHSKDKNKNTVNETLRTRQNVVKMLIACIFVYFLCYSPIQALFISKLFGKTLKPPYVVILVMNCMAFGCSAANPLLYSIFSRKFRTKFAQILKCSRARNSSDSSFVSRRMDHSVSRYMGVSEVDYQEREYMIGDSKLSVKKNCVSRCSSVGTNV